MTDPRLSRTVLLIVALSAASAASAATPPSQRTVRVGIPESSYEERVAAPRTPSRLEVQAGAFATGASIPIESWSDSRVPFETGGAARISVGLLPRLAVLEAGELSLKLGASFTPLSRSGEVSVGSVTTSGSQSLYWLTGSAGVHFEPTWLSTRDASFYLSVAAQPHAVIVTRSVLGDSDTDSALGYEAALGASYRFAGPAAVIGATELTAGMSFQRARLGDATLGGLGVQGGLRWAL